MYENLTEKLNRMWQQSCAFCKTAKSMHAVRLKPISVRVNSKALKKAYYAALKYRFRDIPPEVDKNKRFCIRLIFVSTSTRSQKDVDNLAKLFVDGLHGIFFVNDKQIDHLDILRFFAKDADEEFAMLRIAETKIGKHLDVTDSSFRHGWGTELINVEDFLEKKP